MLDPYIEFIILRVSLLILWLSYDLYCIEVIFFNKMNTGNVSWLFFTGKKKLEYKLEKQCERINILKS